MARNSSAKSKRKQEPQIETEALTWDGVTIEVRYEAQWHLSSKHYVHAHLEIEAVEPSRTPLPITETGYLSHFLSPGLVEEAGGPAAFIRAWLEHAARDPKWRKSEAKRRQLDLFA